MANKTNAFTTRHSNRADIKELMEKLAPLWEANRNSYDTYIAELRQLLADNYGNPLTAGQIAFFLSDDEKERASIEQSVRQLASKAQRKRVLNNVFQDDRCSAIIPELNHEYVTKTRHFAELDDNGNIISKFDKTKTTVAYFLEK